MYNKDGVSKSALPAPAFFVALIPLAIAFPVRVVVELLLLLLLRLLLLLVVVVAVVLAEALAGVVGTKLVLDPITSAVPLLSRLILVPDIVTTPPGVRVIPGPRT